MSDRMPAERDVSPCRLSVESAAYVQGELDVRERSRFEAHLGGCEACSDLVAGLRATLDLIEHDRDRELSSMSDLGLPDRLRAAARRARRVSALRLAAGAVACAVLLVIAFQSMRLRPGPGPRIAAPVAAAELLALGWLLEAQEPGGLWSATDWGGDARFETGLSGLALLALLGAEPRADGQLTEAIDRSIDGLLREQSPDGLFGPSFFAAPYNHGIVTSVLLEASGQRADLAARLDEPIDRALEWIVSAQVADGGWGYLDARGANTSLTYWQLRALLLARGLGREGLRPAIDRGFEWLSSVSDDRGRVGYARRGEFPSGSDTLLAKALACEALREWIDGTRGELAGRWRDGLYRAFSEPGRNGASTYYGDFLALSAYHAGFSTPESARRGAMPESVWHRLAHLIEGQERTGDLRGSWRGHDLWSPAGGRLYATATATLTLQAETRTERVRAMVARRDG